MPVIDAATLSGNADPLPVDDALSVALDIPSNDIPTAPTSQGRKRITFEELVIEDEIDIPDFMR